MDCSASLYELDHTTGTSLVGDKYNYSTNKIFFIKIILVPFYEFLEKLHRATVYIFRFTEIIY